MSRTYTVDGIELPSVTTILSLLDKSDALIPWAVKSCTAFIQREFSRVDRGEDRAYPDLPALLAAAESEWRTARDNAADIGSEIHSLIEKYIKHGLDAVGSMKPEVQNGFLAFLDWEKKMGVTWIASEMTVRHPTLHYAGTLDAVAEIEGKRIVVDFKSSKGFYDTFGLQIAAYRHAYMAMGKEAHGCAVLRLDKVTGVPEWKDYTKRQDRDFRAFEKLLAYWYAAAKRKLANNPRVLEGAM